MIVSNCSTVSDSDGEKREGYKGNKKGLKINFKPFFMLFYQNIRLLQLYFSLYEYLRKINIQSKLANYITGTIQHQTETKISPILSPNEKPGRINYRARQTKYKCVIKSVFEPD